MNARGTKSAMLGAGSRKMGGVGVKDSKSPPLMGAGSDATDAGAGNSGPGMGNGTAMQAFKKGGLAKKTSAIKTSAKKPSAKSDTRKRRGTGGRK